MFFTLRRRFHRPRTELIVLANRHMRVSEPRLTSLRDLTYLQILASGDDSAAPAARHEKAHGPAAVFRQAHRPRPAAAAPGPADGVPAQALRYASLGARTRPPLSHYCFQL